MIKFYIFIGIAVGVALIVKFLGDNSPEKKEVKKKPLFRTLDVRKVNTCLGLLCYNLIIKKN